MGLLDAGEADIVNIREADQMRRGFALGIYPALLAQKLQAGLAEAIDFVCLAWRQVSADPDEPAVAGKAKLGLGTVEPGHDLGQACGGCCRGADQSGISIERVGLEVGRQHDAVAVDDIGAQQWRTDGGAAARALGRAFQQADLGELRRQDRKAKSEQRCTYDKAGARDFEGALAGTFQAYCRRGHQRSPSPTPARIVAAHGRSEIRITLSAPSGTRSRCALANLARRSGRSRKAHSASST